MKKFSLLSMIYTYIIVMSSCGSIPFEKKIYFRTASTNIAKYSYSFNKRQFFFTKKL